MNMTYRGWKWQALRLIAARLGIVSVNLRGRGGRLVAVRLDNRLSRREREVREAQGTLAGTMEMGNA